MSETTANEPAEQRPTTVLLPAPTAWPICAAFGVALLFAGLVTIGLVSMLGALLIFVGFQGWFREVLPSESHERVTVRKEEVPVVTRRPAVARIAALTQAPNRARLPLEIHPVSAGVKGGLAGGVAMAILAMAYGVISHHSIWYPINLLAAGFFPGMTATADLEAFHLDALIFASIIHLLTSPLVGLLYGAMTPMLPRHPFLLGGVIAPILWTGLIHSFLQVINPVMNRRIDWLWFIASQVGFGLVAGWVVSKQERVRTWQHLPFDVRAGMEVQRDTHEPNGDEPPR